jgi:hypothetical protein
MKGEAKAFYVLELTPEELEVLTLAVGGTSEAKLVQLGANSPELVREIYECLLKVSPKA